MTALAISPVNTATTPNGRRNFSATGGTGPYVFSLSNNRSGGSINPSSGLYLAGPHGLVPDTVTVTDATPSTASAVVHVSTGLYQGVQKTIGPPWLKLPNAQIIEGDYGAEKDWQFERARQAVRANMPGYAPFGALDITGRERQLPRATTEASDSGGPNDQAYAERQRVCRTDPHGWAPAGSHASLLYALDRAGFPMGDPDGAHIMQRWKRYSWLTAAGGTPVYGTHPIWTFDGSAPTKWNQFGIIFGADVGGLSSGTPMANLLNGLVDTWRPRKARFMGTWIIVSGPTWGWPVGLVWGGVGLTWGGGVTRFVPPK